MYIKHWLITLISSGLLACASKQAEPDANRVPLSVRGSDCILNGTVRDYQVLDESNLIVTAAAKRKYYVVLSRPAFGLQSSWNLGFTSSTGQICPGFSDVVIQGQGGLDDERISVTSIRELEPEQVGDLLIRFGKKKPAIERNPATGSVQGAEVEELD